MSPQQVEAIYKLGSQFLPGSEFPDTLILEFPGFRALRIKCLLFKPRSLWYFVVAAQAKT